MFCDLLIWRPVEFVCFLFRAMGIRPRIHRKWIKFEASAVFVGDERQQGELPTSLPRQGLANLRKSQADDPSKLPIKKNTTSRIICRIFGVRHKMKVYS
jgi:hypothetical protein